MPAQSIPPVSIHAPVRERPFCTVSIRMHTLVSIHAPVRERLQGHGRARRALGVSIHAPVRERPSARSTSSTPASFNSRSREGATPCAGYARSWNDTVSIHAPVRERLFGWRSVRLGRCFNSRSREGATVASRRGAGVKTGFNSRSREGATRGRWRLPSFALVSIHAPVRERHGEKADGGRQMVVSIHAPVRERRRSN